MPVLPFFGPYQDFQKQLRRLLGFRVKRVHLYRQAFTHKSSLVAVQGQHPPNERLEFLGDAVLDLVIGEYLFKHFPDKDEGQLSQIRSRLVSRECLNKVGAQLNLQVWMFEIAPPSLKTKEFPPTLLGNAFEALLGAVFLDRGYARTYKFFEKVITQCELANQMLEEADTNYKSRLLEWAQKNGHSVEFLHTGTRRKGDHEEFEMEVKVGSITMGKAWGTRKKKAEQTAASLALDHLYEIDWDLTRSLTNPTDGAEPAL